GGDAPALNEIRTCQDLLLTDSQPDLYALARLSHERNFLESRNTTVPGDLPAVWALLGRTARAEALAHGITDPYRQEDALTGLAQALGVAGRHDQAEAVVRGITDRERQATALVGLAEALAEAGEHDHARRLATEAEVLARAMPEPHWTAYLLAI